MKKRYLIFIVILVLLFQTGCQQNNDSEIDKVDGKQDEKSGNKKEGSKGILKLKVEDISENLKLNPDFDPDIKEYNINVQSDIYGVRLLMDCDLGTNISIDGNNIDKIEDDDKKKEEVKEEHYSSVIELSQDIEDYGKELKKTSELLVNGNDLYKFNIVRENAKEYYDKFKVEEFIDPETNIRMKYQLYVPEDYDQNKKYPFIVALHGSGQAKQDVDMILKRYELCTTWLKHGYDDVIIFAPHGQNANKPDEMLETIWSSQGNDSNYGVGLGGQVAYRIIEELRNKYSIDLDRQYLTGLSLGGQGAYAYIAEHPQDWAGVLISCATAWDHDDVVAKNIKDYNIPIWIYHAPDDPTRPYKEFNDMVNALNKYDVKYKVTTFENGEIFYPSAHFSWVPMYSNEDTLKWLMEQSK